jgi:hypothetical protein
MTVSKYLQSGAGRGVAKALGRVFSRTPAALLVAGMVAGAGVDAHAMPFAAAGHVAVGQREHVNIQDVSRLEMAMQPLKENRELFETFLDGYRNLVEDLNDATYEPGKITSRQQMGLFRDVVLEHVARERRELREWDRQEKLESATPASLKSEPKPATVADLYQSYLEGNEYLSAVITRTTEDLAAIVEAGAADEASLGAAFDAFLDFQAQMEALADFEDTGSAPAVPR